MMEKTNNKTIAKNTLFLYFRMMLTIIISLYTSRVVLKVLGIDDFGIYQTVGGVVGLLSFLNAALATGSSRFLTFVVLAVGIAFVAETFGLWFVYNKLVIPSERFDAALIAYHLSVLSAIIHLMQIPCNASIISHEKMEVYAYASIVDAVLELAIVYMLTIGGIDRLVMYSILMCAVTLFMTSFYVLYSKRNFREISFRYFFDKSIMKEVMGYSGWNLFANAALALKNYGSVLLINMFFTPGVVTARVVANQVNMAAYHFITNFRTAVNPQIVKRYAKEDYEGSRSLLLSSTKYSYYMMLFLALPIYLVAPSLLALWLGQIPPYSVIFLKITIVGTLFQVFDTSFYTALYAKGSFPIIYILFRVGFSPETYAWISLISYAILALLVKPILIIKIVDYTWKDILSVFNPCLKVTIVSCFIPLLLYTKLIPFTVNDLVKSGILVSVSVVSVLSAVWLVGITHSEKQKIRHFVKSHL